jgi:hypothetical protein
MTKENARLKVDGVTLAKNPKTKRMDLQFRADGRTLDFTMEAENLTKLTKLMLLRLMEFEQSESVTLLKSFSLQSIEPGATTDGHLYLQYMFENRMGFASGFARQELQNLHDQLGEVLSKPGIQDGREMPT